MYSSLTINKGNKTILLTNKDIERNEELTLNISKEEDTKE